MTKMIKIRRKLILTQVEPKGNSFYNSGLAIENPDNVNKIIEKAEKTGKEM